MAEDAEESVRLVCRAGAEPDVGAPARRAVPRKKTPQSVDRHRSAGAVPQGRNDMSGASAHDVDAAVTEVADQQPATERSEAVRCDDQPPRGVQHAAPEQGTDEAATLGEHVDEPVALARNVVLARAVLL